MRFCNRSLVFATLFFSFFLGSCAILGGGGHERCSAYTNNNDKEDVQDDLSLEAEHIEKI